MKRVANGTDGDLESIFGISHAPNWRVIFGDDETSEFASASRNVGSEASIRYFRAMKVYLNAVNRSVIH